MKQKHSMLVGILVGLVFIWGFIALLRSAGNPASQTSSTGGGQAVTEEQGTQVIHILARGGYSPRLISAKAGVPTRLELQTKGSYDCSTSFTIPSLGIRQQLPATGITKIDIPAQAAGSTLTGLCGMGMYSFDINFN